MNYRADNRTAEPAAVPNTPGLAVNAVTSNHPGTETGRKSSEPAIEAVSDVSVPLTQISEAPMENGFTADADTPVVAGAVRTGGVR